MPTAVAPAEMLATGMFTPVGLNSRAAAAAIRGDISRALEEAFHNRITEPQVIARVGGEYLAPLARVEDRGMTTAHYRMLQLGVPALAEACQGVVGAPLPLMLALPEVPASARDPVGPAFLAQLGAEAQVKLALGESRVFRQGGAGGMFALDEGLALLRSGRVPYVLVGGIDTFVDARRLEMASLERRARASDAVDYFTPGEAATFLLLGAAGRRKRPGERTMAEIVAVGLGTEPGHRYSSEPYRGEGLSEAFRNLFAQVAPDFPRVGCVYAGFNGENLSAKEWMVASTRSSKRFDKDEVAVFHPADCIGDAGAALGPVMLACAAIGIQRAYRSSPCLVWSTSDREARGAALVQSARAGLSVVR
jgi:3-oxoacyl-[acyl-carrier-protein] synthase-1